MRTLPPKRDHATRSNVSLPAGAQRRKSSGPANKVKAVAGHRKPDHDASRKIFKVQLDPNLESSPMIFANRRCYLVALIGYLIMVLALPASAQDNAARDEASANQAVAAENAEDAVKELLVEANIGILYPQMNVHIRQSEA